MQQKFQNLTNEEKKAFDIHAQLPAISNFSDHELLLQIPVLIAKICVITGWILPQDENYKKVLYDQLAKKLREDYSSLNVNEIEYAFRKYGTTVEDWGKAFNLNLIDKVLIPYFNFKYELMNFVNRIKVEEKQLPAPEMQADWKELCEQYYQDYRNGKYNFLLMPAELYDEFVKVEMMAADAYEDYLPDAKSMVLGQLKEEKENSFGYERHELEQKIIKVESGEDESNVIRYAKKLSVTLLYKKATAKKFKNLFVNE